MQKIENAVIVEKTDTLADIVKEFCDNTADAKKLLKTLFAEFPELESKPKQQNECLNQLCYVSNNVNFVADNFSVSDFLRGIENRDIYKLFVSSISSNEDHPYSTEKHGNWCYAIPCDKIKVEIEIGIIK